MFCRNRSFYAIQKETKSIKAQSKKDESTRVRDKAATNTDVSDSEKYNKEKFYYNYYFIKKKDAKTQEKIVGLEMLEMW